MIELTERHERSVRLKECGYPEFPIEDITERNARFFVCKRNVFDVDFVKNLEMMAALHEKQKSTGREFCELCIKFYCALGESESTMYVMRFMHDNYGQEEEQEEETSIFRL